MSLVTPAGGQAERRAVCVERRMHGSVGGVGLSSQEAVRAYPTEAPFAARGAERVKPVPQGRAQVDCILNAKGNISIETLQRAAVLVGRELRLELT
jgi:hypothetical protein